MTSPYGPGIEAAIGQRRVCLWDNADTAMARRRDGQEAETRGQRRCACSAEAQFTAEDGGSVAAPSSSAAYSFRRLYSVFRLMRSAAAVRSL
jgi:hypothetical protein